MVGDSWMFGIPFWRSGVMKKWINGKVGKTVD